MLWTTPAIVSSNKQRCDTEPESTGGGLAPTCVPGMTLRALLPIVLLAAPVASAEDCAPLSPEQSEYGYRQLEDRCEGFYRPKLRGFLQVVSFMTASSLADVSWDQDTRLLVASADRSGPEANIRAVTLPRDVFYQMDATLEVGGVLEWPIAPFLLPRGVGPEQLGIYGWTGSEEEKTFVPVNVGALGPNEPSDQAVELMLRSEVNLTHFRWSLLQSTPPSCQATPGLDVFESVDSDLGAGSIISITLPQSGPAQTRCLEIQYRPENRRWKSHMIRIRL